MTNHYEIDKIFCMRKFFCAFITVLLYTSLGLAATDVMYDFVGTWKLNDADAYFGGVLEIENCTDIKCDFKIQSWYDQHICDTDGQIELKSADTGVYNSKKFMYDGTKDLEYYVPVGIKFELLPDGGLKLKYVNADSHATYFGMSATVEGTWFKQKD